MRHERHGFSLMELLLVIALIAIFVAASYLITFDVVRASESTVEKRNIQVWNNAYTNLVAASPEFAELSWPDASSQLAAGVQVKIADSVFSIRSESPSLDGRADLVFVKGTGIVTTE